MTESPGRKTAGSTGAGSATAQLRHDIAGPLTAIIGAAELILMRRAGLSDDIRRRLEGILESCGRISGILERSRREERGDR